MKRLYWRPAGPSRQALLAVALAAVALLTIVEHLPLSTEKGGHVLKLEAARRTEMAFGALKAERQRLGIMTAPEADPAGTGMIGATATEITTSTGNLSSKQTTANPNFAAVIVEYMRRLELETGDVVAVGYSGSFPSVNTAVLMAIETMGLEPLVIASATSSDWGASNPEFMWLDMEAHLRRRGLTQAKSLGASMGGIEDQGIGLSDAGRLLVIEGIKRNDVPFIDRKDFLDSLETRMELYDEAANGRPVRAYVNVGGGSVSVGRSRGKSFYKPGINRPGPAAPVDSIIGRFLDRGVPVIHLSKAKVIAEQFGLPVEPRRKQVVGRGEIYRHTEPNRGLALAAILLLGLLIFFVGRRARARAHLKTLPEGVVVDERGIEARQR